MKLSCGYMLIDTQKLYSKNKVLKFNGQICVDGVETFLVKEDGNGNPRYFISYDKRHDVFNKVKEYYGDKLNEEIDKLVIEKAVSVREIKKNLSAARKADRINNNTVQNKTKKK